MVRMTNKVTRSVANVSEDKANRLGSDWEPVEKPKRSSKKADDKSE